MATLAPFQALSKLYYIAASNSASTPVQINGSGQPNNNNYLVTNEGTVPVFFNLTVTSTNVVAPTAGNPQDCYEILSGAAGVFSGPPNAFCSTITKAGTANISIQQGSGF